MQCTTNPSIDIPEESLTNIVRLAKDLIAKHGFDVRDEGDRTQLSICLVFAILIEAGPPPVPDPLGYLSCITCMVEKRLIQQTMN